MKIRRVAIAVASACKKPSTAFTANSDDAGRDGAADNRSIFGLATQSSGRMKPSIIIGTSIIGKRQSQRSPTQPFGSSLVTLH